MFAFSKFAVVRTRACFCKLKTAETSPRHLHKYYSTTKQQEKAQVAGRQEARSFGQPTPDTHPHLIRNADELRPFVMRSEFAERRQRLVETICSDSANCKHLIVIPSASKQFMSESIPYVFRQNSDFLYFTGCMEPDSCLLVAVSDSPANHKATLFVREKDSHSELWDGPRTGVKQSVDFFGVDHALPVGDLEQFLQGFAKANYKLWYDGESVIQQSVHAAMEKFESKFESPIPSIHNLRLIKSPAEIELMRHSCEIASQAISDTIRYSRPGISEHEIFAKVDFECRKNGADYLAYPPVVAGGKRATIIHYINNNQIVNDGDMVLMDAGCEYHGYTSDITRTWPIGGKFTDPQRVVYEIVLDVQQKLIEACQERPKLDELFQIMCKLLGKRLQEIGLIPASASDKEAYKAAFSFCPHHVSHYLGMDVHDTAAIQRNIDIRPGMVVTVEPGIYIGDKHKVPAAFRGIGIRIEDDVLITEDGPVVLTRKCPKSVEEIESVAS